MDEGLALLLDVLDGLGIYDSSLIVFTSDHGEEFGEHGKVAWHSHTLYDELLRIPLLIKLPDNRHGGRRVSTPVQSIDIAPTILAALDLPPPDGFDGRNLLELLERSGSEPLATVARLDYGTDSPDAIQRGRWKLYGESLFDLVQDPRETIDVASEHPAVVAELAAELEAARSARLPVEAEEVRLAPETEEQLKALGYLK